MKSVFPASKFHRFVVASVLVLTASGAFGQTVSIVPLVPSAAPGVPTGPGTATITGAQGQGKGTITASLPASVPIIDCPNSTANPKPKCLGPTTLTITHTLTGFGRFTISTSDDGLKLVKVGNTFIQQCSVAEGFGPPAPKSFTCQFDYLPYLASGNPYTTQVRVD